MERIEQLLKKAGWKKAPDFNPEQVARINNLAIVKPLGGFIICPFGFRGGLDNQNRVRFNPDLKGGLKPNCPVHGDNCPGLKKYV